LHHCDQTIWAQVCGDAPARNHRHRHETARKRDLLLYQIMELRSKSEVISRVFDSEKFRFWTFWMTETTSYRTAEVLEAGLYVSIVPLPHIFIPRSQSWCQDMGTFHRFVLEILLTLFPRPATTLWSRR
jgi:hypothetical protein